MNFFFSYEKKSIYKLTVEKNYTLDNMAQRIQAAAMQAIKQRRVS